MPLKDVSVRGDSTQKFTCFACGKEFRRKFNMYRHMDSCTGKDPRSHPAPPPLNHKYPCQMCGRVLSNKFNMKRHIMKCSGKPYSPQPKRTFSCAQCNVTFKRKDSLLRHQVTCQGPCENTEVLQCTFSCAQCNVTFKRKDSFLRHQRTCKGPREKTKSLQCTACKKVLCSKQYFNIHVAKCKGPPVKPTARHKCSNCLSTFSTSYGLSRHLNTCVVADKQGPTPPATWKCPFAKEGMRCVHYTFDERPGYLAAHFRVDHPDLFADVEDGMPRINRSVAMAKEHLEN